MIIYYINFLFHYYMIFKYVAGSNINSVLNKKLNKGIIPIINYISENNIDNLDVTYKEYNNLISKIDYSYILAFKLSSLNFNTKLIENIVKKGLNKDIKIIIDAEDNKNIENYRKISNDLITKYNKNKENIIKTYQMYRKDSLDELSDDINHFNKLNINLSSKLVRGAYFNSEKNGEHLFKNKKDTDWNYNMGILKCYESSNTHIIASHNKFSLNLAYLLSKNKNKFLIANLMGMNEEYISNFPIIGKCCQSVVKNGF